MTTDQANAPTAADVADLTAGDVPLLSLAVAARLIGLSVASTRALALKGKLPPVRASEGRGKLRFRPVTISRYILQHERA
jgi:hypothetical protein